MQAKSKIGHGGPDLLANVMPRQSTTVDWDHYSFEIADRYISVG